MPHITALVRSGQPGRSSFRGGCGSPAARSTLIDVDRIRAFHRAEPFQAFTIRLPSGDEHRVDHHERLAIIAGGQAIAVTEPIEPFPFVEIEEIASITADGRAGDTPSV